MNSSNESFKLSEESVHFSQLASLEDASLSDLRDQVKKVMIPLLIKAFRYQLEMLPPLQKSQTDSTCIKEVHNQLRRLDSDLQNLQLWIESCRSQVLKALSSSESTHKAFLGNPEPCINPSVVKAFQKVMGSSERFCSKEGSWFKNLLSKK